MWSKATLFSATLGFRELAASNMSHFFLKDIQLLQRFTYHFTMIVEKRVYLNHYHTTQASDDQTLESDGTIRWDPEDMHGILIVYKCGDLSFLKKNTQIAMFFKKCPKC